jgi:hypothetical protein
MRVKERSTFVGNWIWDSLATRLKAITRWTGQAKVVERRFAASGAGNNVFDLKSRDGKSLYSSTVGAAIGKNRADLTPQLD